MASSGTTVPSQSFRVTIIALLLFAYAGLGVYFNHVVQEETVYTHLAYVPIALAGIWWGLRGVWVAVLSAVALFAFHVFGVAAGEISADGARSFFFIFVGLCAGTLGERLLASRKALRHSEEKYRLIVEKSLAGILVCRDKRVLFANSRAGDMFAYQPRDMVGMSIWNLIHEPDQPRVRELLLKRAKEGITDLHYECRLVRKDSGFLWAEIASSPADYEGGPAVLVHVYDITDKKEAEARRRELSELARRQEEQLVHSTRLAELGEMAAAIAHELNQPLTGIRNFARNALYMLDQGVGSADEVKDNLRTISEQVDRAARIINQMRDLTRRSEGRFTPMSINSAIEECVEFLTPQLKLACVETELDLADNLPDVRGDNIRLEQVFLNLITNARQAMAESQKRRLKIKTYCDAGADRPVVAEITDTGRGFTQEEAQKLFAPFFTTKKAGHGTGLGLSISLTIIEDHNGAIEAGSAPGRGATFTVRLPATREENAPEASKKDA